MSLPCTSKNTFRFLTLVKQKFDRLVFLCFICHGTFQVLWCLSHQVLDQKYFAAPKKLNRFSLVTMLTPGGLADSQKQFLLHLECYLVYEKEHEVGHCYQLCLLLVVVYSQYIEASLKRM